MSLNTFGIEHIVITRFSFRGKEAFKKQRIRNNSMWKMYEDPLKKSNLEYRFKIFEITCLPSILNQINQEFTWILIIDKDLPNRYKEKLSILLSERKHTFLYTYDGNYDLEEINWLKPYFKIKPKYILTTNMDDDDGIPTNFTQVIHQHIQQQIRSGRIPPYQTMAAKNIVQLDLITSTQAPYGWLCDWHRKIETASCGFSFCCKYPEYNYSVLGLDHAFAQNYFSPNQAPVSKNVEIYRKLLKVKEIADIDFSPKELFYDFSIKTGPVLMVNHCKNVQVWRLYEKKPNYKKLLKPENLDNINLNWGKLKNYSRYFSNHKALRSFLEFNLQGKYRQKKYNLNHNSLIEFFKILKGHNVQ